MKTAELCVDHRLWDKTKNILKILRHINKQLLSDTKEEKTMLRILSRQHLKELRTNLQEPMK